MTEQPMSENVDPNCIWKVVFVQAPQAVAWRVFTEKMGAWWPLAYYKIGKANAIDAVIEPHVGGRWYERGDDGTICQWGSVLAWEPQSRLVLSWDINAEWQYDPTLKTEIEVRFNADGSDRTRIELDIAILTAMEPAAMRCVESTTPKAIGVSFSKCSLALQPKHRGEEHGKYQPGAKSAGDSSPGRRGQSVDRHASLCVQQ
jgi:uncharacterized protein YndB with AHSA1/START domain